MPHKVLQRILMSLLLLLSIGFGHVASAATASATVESVNQRVMQALRANKAQYAANPDALVQLVQNDIVPFIDFTAFSKLILSKHWRTATPPQRTAFEQAFKGMLMRTYTRSMLEYSDADLSIQRELPGSRPHYAKVYGKFVIGNGQPDVSVIFEMREVDGRWKAYNVTVKAFSLVENFRSTFGKEINQYGLDKLIQRLQQGEITQ